MRNKHKNIIVALGISLICTTLSAQQTYINREWVSTSGSVGTIHRTASALDNNQNLIVVSNIINSSNNTDVLITKYNPDGVVLWQQDFDGSAHGDDYAVKLKINNSNEIFVASALTENTGVDFGLLKYSSNGTLAWSNSWNGSANGVDVPADLDIDNSGNIYLVGGSGTANGTADYAIVKFNANGTYQWHTNYDYANLHDVASSLDIYSNSVVVTGASASTQINWDFTTLKLNTTNGSIVHTERTGVAGVGLDNAVAVTTDISNNTYITGYVEINGNRNIQTVKLNSNFGLEWVKNFDGGLEDVANTIGVDNFGNIYIAGSTENQNGGKDYITIKYDQSGNEVWHRKFGSEGNNYLASAENIAISNNGDVVVTGTLDNNNIKEFATVKYTSTGDLKFVQNFDAGSQNNEAKSVIVKNNNIYVSGIAEVSGTNQNTSVKYSTKIRPINIVSDANGIEFVQNELIIRFDKTAMFYNKIDDKKFTAGKLTDFVKPSVISQMNQKTGLDWTKADAYKIFLRMTTADSVSVTRLGEIIKLDDYWATLVVYIPNGNNNEQTIADSLNRLPSSLIHYSEKDYVGHFNAVPNDYFYVSEQNGLYNPTHGIDVEDAWDNQIGQTYTKVGVFDTGINWRHEDFGDGTSAGSKIVGGWDYSNNMSPFSQTRPDSAGHGTAGSGLIGALRNNGKGIAGVAGGNVQNGNTGCQLFSMKIGNDGILTSVVSPAIVEGAAYNPNTGFGYGLHIQNHSWGTTENSIILRNAVKSCYENSCTFVASSGNDGDTPNPTIIKFPASYNDNWVIKVGANDISGNRANFSTYGNNLDVIAPGTHDQYIALSHIINNGYVDFFGAGTFNGSPIDGTSFAAPLTSGVSALLYSQHHPSNNPQYPNVLAPEDIEVMLQSFASDVNATGYDQFTGYGRVDAQESLNRVSLPYRVRHFQQSVSTASATLVATGVYVNNPYSVSPIPLNSGALLGFIADIYKITVTLPHNIPTTETYLGGWVRNSSCDLYGYNSGGGNPIWANVTLDASDQNSATLTGYIYRVQELNIWLQPVDNIWLPVDLNSTVNFAYSIYTLDNDPNAGTDENELENSFNLYPNPTNNQMTINYTVNTSDNNVSLKIFDVIGNIVYEQYLGEKSTGKYNDVINVSNLSNGMYFCKLQVGTDIITKQLIKQ